MKGYYCFSICVNVCYYIDLNLYLVVISIYGLGIDLFLRESFLDLVKCVGSYGKR